MTMLNLHDLARLVDRHWNCTEKEYPPLRHLSDPEDRRRFNLRHALSHLHKQLGKLEEGHEAAEHGDPALLNDHERTVALLGKSLIGIMHYASLSGCSVEEIEGWVQKWVEENEGKTKLG